MQTVDILEGYPMVEGLVLTLQNDHNWTTDETITCIKRIFDQYGPYAYAKKYDLLINNSGEEFAIQFMSFYNTHVRAGTY